MAKYAFGTTVPVERSFKEAEKIVRSHGGSMVSFGWRDEETEIFAFQWRGDGYRFAVPSPADQKERRRQWRVLCALKLKPLFELIDEEEDQGRMHLDAYRILDQGGTAAELIVSGRTPIALGTGPLA